MTRERMSPISMAIAISKAWGNRFPVKVREIAFELGRKQRDPIAAIEPIAVRGVEGVLAKNGGMWGIGYSSFIRETGKINFTIAHELGHYESHRRDADQIICTRDDMTDFANRKGAEKNIEQEANEFASYLLMPINDFRAQVDGHAITIDLLAHCCDRYETSLSASAVKLIDFTERGAAVIVSQDGRVVWSRSSAAALRSGFYFKKGTQIPTRSHTRKCDDEGTAKNAPGGVLAPSPVWGPGFDVVESAIAQPYYGTVFTVLELRGSVAPAISRDDVQDTPDAYDHFRRFSR